MATTRKERPGATVVPECPENLSGDLGWLLGQAHFSLGTQIAAAFVDLGVSQRGYHVLSTALHTPRTQTEIADLIGVDKTTMVVTVDELERQGLAERRPSETDRRARVIAVTDHGVRMVAEGRDLIGAIQAEVLATLPDDEREVFVSALRRLVQTRLAEPQVCRMPPQRRKAPRA